eukprot:gene7244-biopygen10109
MFSLAFLQPFGSPRAAVRPALRPACRCVPSRKKLAAWGSSGSGSPQGNGPEIPVFPESLLYLPQSILAHKDAAKSSASPSPSAGWSSSPSAWRRSFPTSPCSQLSDISFPASRSSTGASSHRHMPTSPSIDAAAAESGGGEGGVEAGALSDGGSSKPSSRKLSVGSGESDDAACRRRGGSGQADAADGPSHAVK